MSDLDPNQDSFTYQLPELEGKPQKIERCILFKQSRNVQLCFTQNTPKQQLVLEHVLQYQKQFATIHDPSRLLFMSPQNQCGVLKFICTTLRPTKLPFVELYDYESCAKFISRFIDYQQLNPPTQFPRIIPSPSNVLKWQRGDCFDMSIVLASLLIGYGYDAYVVYGRAPKFITTKDQALLQCPYPLSYELSDIKSELPDEWGAKKEKPTENQIKLNKQYKFPPKPRLASMFIEKKDRQNTEESKRKFIAEHTIDDDQPDMEKYDDLLNQRLHCWVILKKGKRELNQTFFIEPTTGRRYDIDTCPYLSVDAIFNDKNFWINLHPHEQLSQLDWDFQLKSQNPDEMNWEYVMLIQDEGQEQALNQLTQQNEPALSVNQQSDDQQESDEEVLDMPPPWPPKLIMDKQAYHKISPLGEQTSFYQKCKVDIFAEYSQPDGLILRLTIYKDFQRHIIEQIRSHFKHRKDRLLVRRRFPFQFRTIQQYSPHKDTNFWQRMEYINGQSRKLWFYPFRNDDGLIYREQNIGKKTIQKYKGRDDRLIYRSCSFHTKQEQEKRQGELLFEDNHCGTCVIEKMVQKYEINTSEDAPLSQHQIAKTEMNMEKDMINIFYHYEQGKITASQKPYSRKQLLGGSAQAAEMQGEVDNAEESADQQQKQAIMQREIECHVQVKTNQQKAKNQMEVCDCSRKQKQDAIQDHRDNMENIFTHVLQKSVYEKAREKSKQAHLKAEEEAEDKKEQHFLMPILKKLGYDHLTKLDPAQAINVKNEALRRLKERLLARADIIQKRIQHESEQLKQFYNNHIRNRDPSAADDKNFDETVNRMNFKIEILTERASQHYRHALRKFEQLDHKLMQEELLSALHQKK